MNHYQDQVLDVQRGDSIEIENRLTKKYSVPLPLPADMRKGMRLDGKRKSVQVLPQHLEGSADDILR